MTEQARCLKARYYKGMANHAGQDSGIAIPVLTKNKGERIKTAIKIIGEINSSQGGKILSTDGIAKCHSAGHMNNPKIAIPVLTPDRAEKRQNGRRFKDDGEPMFTLTGQDRHGIAIEVKEATANTLDTSCNQGIFVQVSDELIVYAAGMKSFSVTQQSES